MPAPVPPPAPPQPAPSQPPAGRASGWLRRVNRLLQGPQSRLRVRHRFAALGVVGALMCALPLLQVLRYQADALGATRAAQAALDPLAHAVGVQRGLVLHRDVAGAVLRGASAREPERRQRQRVVNERLTDLELALRGNHHARAAQEGEALRADWTVLSRRVEERSLEAPDSDAAHRLLVEQTLQVVDELSVAALGQGGLAAPEVTAWLHPVLHTLPRLSARLGLLASAEPGSTETHPREFAAAQQRLDRVMADLGAVSTHGKAPGTGNGNGSLATGSPLAALQQRADLYFGLHRSSAPPAQLQAAAQALGAAEVAFTVQAQARLAAALAAREEQLSTQRLALMAALAVLLVLGTGLGLSLLPPSASAPRRRARPSPRRFNAADPAATDSMPASGADAGTTPERQEAQHLLQRLRVPAERPPQSPRDIGSPQTLPPKD